MNLEPRRACLRCRLRLQMSMQKTANAPVWVCRECGFKVLDEQYNIDGGESLLTNKEKKLLERKNSKW